MINPFSNLSNAQKTAIFSFVLPALIFGFLVEHKYSLWLVLVGAAGGALIAYGLEMLFRYIFTKKN